MILLHNIAIAYALFKKKRLNYLFFKSWLTHLGFRFFFSVFVFVVFVILGKMISISGLEYQQHQNS